METISEQLSKILKNLENTGGIEQAAVISRDGLLICSLEKKAEAFAAMTATKFGAAETASIEIGKGIPMRVTTETDSGKIIAVSAGPKALLAVITTANAGLGLVLLEMESAAQKIKEILE